jgi:hypothetical protein
MARDRLVILENMAVGIDDLCLIRHQVLLEANRS